MDKLDEELKSIKGRLEALENMKTAPADQAAISTALDNHPLMRRIAGFLGKWQRDVITGTPENPVKA